MPERMNKDKNWFLEKTRGPINTPPPRETDQEENQGSDRTELKMIRGYYKPL